MPAGFKLTKLFLLNHKSGMTVGRGEEGEWPYKSNMEWGSESGADSFIFLGKGFTSTIRSSESLNSCVVSVLGTHSEAT